MRKPRIVILVALLVGPCPAVDLVFAQTQPQVASNPIRAEAELLKTIVFLTVEAIEPGKPGQADQRVTISGTGFLVSVPDSRLGKDLAFGYVVTNRHVAKAIEQDENGDYKPLQIQGMYITLNLREPVNGNRSEKVSILSRRTQWYFPKDEASDLAVLPFAIPAKYDSKQLLLENLLTEEILNQKNVGPGDKVLTGGLLFWLRRASRDSTHTPRRCPGNAARRSYDHHNGQVRQNLSRRCPYHSRKQRLPIFIVPGLGLGVPGSISGIPMSLGYWAS